MSNLNAHHVPAHQKAGCVGAPPPPRRSLQGCSLVGLFDYFVFDYQFFSNACLNLNEASSQNSTFIQISADLPSPAGREPKLSMMERVQTLPPCGGMRLCLSRLTDFPPRSGSEEVVGTKPRSGRRRGRFIWNLDGETDLFIPQAAPNKQKRSSDPPRVDV